MHHLDIDALATVVAIANRASFSAASRDGSGANELKGGAG
jgi:hypothetical protein